VFLHSGKGLSVKGRIESLQMAWNARKKVSKLSTRSILVELIGRLIPRVHVLPVLWVSPPSTTISVPVMYEASLLAKNNAAWATSHAVPILPVGTC